jgi:hypothetical protein
LQLVHKGWGFCFDFMRHVARDRNGLSDLWIPQNKRGVKNFVNLTDTHKSRAYLFPGASLS